MYVLVFLHGRVSGREQEHGVAILKVSDGGVNVLEREVDEAISTQDYVDFRYLIARNIQDDETSILSFMYSAIPGDKFRHHISPYVYHSSQVDIPHPIDISTSSIEQ